MNKNLLPDSKLKFKWWVANLAEILPMLETLYEKCPKAFFSEEKKVKPLKIGIHKDIKIALGLKKESEAEYSYKKKLIWGTLGIYTRTPEYLQI